MASFDSETFLQCNSWRLCSVLGRKWKDKYHLSEGNAERAWKTITGMHALTSRNFWDPMTHEIAWIVITLGMDLYIYGMKI